MIFSDVARTTILSGIFIAILFSLAPAWGRLAPYDGIGGNGGYPFKIDCGESALLVGVTGRSGAFIDQVAGLCVKIDPVSGNWVGGVYETARAGGNGGGPFSQVCPVGTALVGIEGTTDRFNGTLIVASLKIECTTLKIRTEYQPAVIKGIRRIGIYSDPAPTKNAAQQDLCYQPLSETDRSQDQWVPVGVALEGRAGLFLDHIHILCGEIRQDSRGYRIDFRSSAQAAVPEGTPLQISWRAHGAKPELTPNLSSAWELHDYTHIRAGFLGPQSTPVQNPCSYSAPPCESGWSSAHSGSQVTFHSLPPARYGLRVTVSTTSQTYTQSVATHNFEIRENLLATVTVDPVTIRNGGISLATISLEGPAPPQGKKIYVSSSNPQLVPVPESLTIPGGAASTTVSLKTDSKLLGGQTTIRASLKKPLVSALSKNPQMRAFSRGIHETDEQLAIGSQKHFGEAHPTQEIQESHLPAFLDSTGRNTADPGVSPPTEQFSQDQEITERGITGFGKVQSSRSHASILATKPNPGAATTFPEVEKTPLPPQPVPIPYPVTSEKNLSPSTSKIQQTPKVSIGLLTIPSETKEAVLTVQNPTIRTQPPMVPKVPPLQK